MEKYPVLANNRIKLTNIYSMVLIVIGTLSQLISAFCGRMGPPKIHNILHLN